MEKLKTKINSQDVADYILAFANEVGESVTNLKLQKILYYVQAWHLANFSKPLFDEDFEAWVHGPVLPNLYQQYKDFKSAPITTKLQEKNVEKRFQKKTLEFLQEVIRVYMPSGGYQLELMTHQEDPWVNARKGCKLDEGCNNVISKTSMQNFYGKKIKD